MSIFQTHIIGPIRELTKRYGKSRSLHWGKVRDQFIKDNPACAVCGKKNGLNVHHQKPFHLYPSLELDPKNLITLCRVDHFIFGHLYNWKSYNINVREDAKEWRDKIRVRP